MAGVLAVKDPKVRTLITNNNQRVLNREEDIKITRRKPVYPISAERELARVYLSLSVCIKKVSKPFIDRLAAVYGVWADENIRVDARINIQDAVAEILDEYGSAISDGFDSGSVLGRVVRAANVAKSASVRDWGTIVKDSMDMQIDEPFYMETLDDLVNKWAYESTRMITSYPQEYLGKVQEVITWGITTHQPLVNVYRRLEKVTGDIRSHVRMIARDQMGTLNCRMTQYEHESLGVTEYVWVTKRDNRVRECHRELNGKIFSWNNPPAMWYMTQSRGIVYTGRYCHPGEDYGCRCTAKPVFDKKSVDAAIVSRRTK